MYLEKLRIDGKAAIVTGASRGIGKSIALALAEAGAEVVLSSRKKETLEEVAKEIKAKGGKAHVIPAHGGKIDDLKNLVKGTVETCGRLDILINNSATNPVFGPTLDVEEGVWDKIFEVNLKGPFFLSRLAFAEMSKKGSGSIVNVASGAGIRPMTGLGVYSISKAGLISMTKVLAREWAAAGVRVNAIAPGLTDTRFAAFLIQNEEILSEAMKMTPLGRYAAPDEMALAVLYLASDASSYVTGETIVIDGGTII